MKWFFFLLLILNVSLYVWVNRYQAHDIDRESFAEPNAPVQGMELVHERNDRLTSDGKHDCMRIGPFSTADTFSRASRSLINEGFGFSRNVVSARELRNFRVYLGPFSTEAAQRTSEARLDQAGLDYYEFEAREGTLLSLAGLFSDGEVAGAYVATLKQEGLDAKARSEARTLGPWRWLEVSDVVTDDRRGVLRQIDWRDAKVQVAVVPCGGASTG